MYFDPAFILPKIFGLFLMTVWIYTSLRQLWMYKYADVVTGNVVDIIDNPDTSNRLNKIATIEFSYHDQKVTMEHYFSGSKNDFLKEVMVYINKKNIERSVVRPSSKLITLVGFIVPIVFSVLILLSFFRVKGC